MLGTSIATSAFHETVAASADTVVEQDEILIAANPSNQSYYEALGQALQNSGDSYVHVFVNGSQPSFDVQPFISDGRVLTPIRGIATSLGMNVSWDPNTQQVTLSTGQHTAVLTIGSNLATVDGTTITLDVPSTIENGRTFVPLRFVSQALDAQVSWYPTGQIVSVMSSTGTSELTNSATSQSSPNILVQVPAMSQDPELSNGCEATSMSMLLNWAGKSIDKMQVANDMPKDTTPVQYDSNGNIVSWGDPNYGFVGDVTGANIGYAIYHGPMYSLLNQYLPGQAVDLTGSSFQQVLDHLQLGKPVMAWTTSFFYPTNNWVTWQGPKGPFQATFDEHCVLLVGYNLKKNIVFINDPLDGTSGKAVPMDSFKQAWEQLGSQALSVE